MSVGRIKIKIQNEITIVSNFFTLHDLVLSKTVKNYKKNIYSFRGSKLCYKKEK